MTCTQPFQLTPLGDACDECGGPLYTNPEGDTGCVHCHSVGCSTCGDPDHSAPNCPHADDEETNR